MEQIIIFEGCTLTELQEKVNAWLACEETRDRCHVVNRGAIQRFGDSLFAVCYTYRHSADKKPLGFST